jgi:hypothetical protein
MRLRDQTVLITGAGACDPAAVLIPLTTDRPPTRRDHAYAARFLASDESAYMSVVCRPVTDGGVLAGLHLGC